ncbi:hypothetical protein [Paludibacterium denitrificans]|uniref:Uncharacterized protein n=1 Tax=Paludibacterium denitrificans TaxID=2675226 RepID=A0A844GFJ8_9NEIS|nr:hypothetical protein [Paludibacterium denitrificans]MTD33305.1 hypothetical protein [Paludibacterium denitrificans]
MKSVLVDDLIKTIRDAWKSPGTSLYVLHVTIFHVIAISIGALLFFSQVYLPDSVYVFASKYFDCTTQDNKILFYYFAVVARLSLCFTLLCVVRYLYKYGKKVFLFNSHPGAMTMLMAAVVALLISVLLVYSSCSYEPLCKVKKIHKMIYEFIAGSWYAHLSVMLALFAWINFFGKLSKVVSKVWR